MMTDDITDLKRQGNLQFAQRAYPDAERSFREIVRIAPDAHEGYVGLAKVLTAQGRIDEIINLVDPVIDRMASLQLLKYLAEAYRAAVLRGNTAVAGRAIALSERYLSERPDSVMLFYLGEIYEALGDPDRALQSYIKSLEIEPKDQLVYKRAVARAKKFGKPDAAARAEELWRSAKK